MARISIGDISLDYDDVGTGDVVLLVHGFPLTRAMWRHQVEFLSQRCRVIAPDLRGFGQSDASGDVVPMEQFADDLARLLDALGVRERIVFCGLSMGGYIGWQFVRRHGDRLAALIQCDTRSAPDTPEAAKNRHEMARKVFEQGVEKVCEAMLPKLLGKKSLEERPELVRAIRAMMSACSPQGVAAAARGMAQRYDAAPWLATIRVPTLLIVGAEDAISPPDEMRAFGKLIPHSDFAFIPDAGHMAPMENAAEVNRVIGEFLNEIAFARAD